MAADTHPDWQLAIVVETEPAATGIRRITIRRPPSCGAPPGSHLDVRVNLGDRSDTRSYSVVASNPDGSLLTLSVLLSPQSRGGSSFMHRLDVGDTLLTTQPLQNFPLRVGAPRYVLLAGGIGITAVIAMSRVLKTVQADYLLVYAGRSRAAMAYLTELSDLHSDRLHVHADDEGTALDVTALTREIADDPRRDRTELYMCGPIRLMDAARRSWSARELPVQNLRYETFGNSGWFEPEEFLVRIPRLDVETTVAADTTILEALTNAGVEMMFDCRKGECGLCQVDVQQVDGVIDHRDVFFSDKQHRAGTRLCSCVSRVAGNRDGQTMTHSGKGVERPVLVIDIP